MNGLSSDRILGIFDLTKLCLESRTYMKEIIILFKYMVISGLEITENRFMVIEKDLFDFFFHIYVLYTDLYENQEGILWLDLLTICHILCLYLYMLS